MAASRCDHRLRVSSSCAGIFLEARATVQVTRYQEEKKTKILFSSFFALHSRFHAFFISEESKAFRALVRKHTRAAISSLTRLTAAFTFGPALHSYVECPPMYCFRLGVLFPAYGRAVRRPSTLYVFLLTRLSSSKARQRGCDIYNYYTPTLLRRKCAGRDARPSRRPCARQVATFGRA